MSLIPRGRSHVFAEPAPSFSVTTKDGVRLLGTRIGSADPAVVLCHGFTGWHRKPRPARFAEALSRWLTVYGFDFRGHGASGGYTTFGDLEVNDVAAVVSLARDDGHDRVATMGASLGGIAVIRHAALLGGTDAAIAVSSPARWEGHTSESVRRMQWLASTRRGRRLARLVGLRLPDTWEWPESPEDVVDRIAPVPLLIVHGRDDHFFDEEEAWRLYRKAGQPKRLLLASRFGHAEDGYSRGLAERVARFVYASWELRWPG